MSSQWEDNNPTGEKPKRKIRITKKHGLILWGVLTVLLIGFIAYTFGFKKWEESVYQRGVVAGQTAVNNAVINQICTQGKTAWNVPLKDGKCDANGTITTLILIPQTNGQ
jgi:hypothetical protein